MISKCLTSNYLYEQRVTDAIDFHAIKTVAYRVLLFLQVSSEKTSFTMVSASASYLLPANVFLWNAGFIRSAAGKIGECTASPSPLQMQAAEDNAERLR